MANVESNFASRAQKFLEYVTPGQIENAHSYYKHNGVKEAVQKAGNELRAEEKKQAEQKPLESQKKAGGLHSYDSFERSQSSQLDQPVMNRQQLAALGTASAGWLQA